MNGIKDRILLCLLMVITVITSRAVKAGEKENDKTRSKENVETISFLQKRPSANQNNVIWNWDDGYKSFSLKESDGNLIELSGLGGAVEIDGKTYFLENAKVISKPITKRVGKTAITTIEYLLSGISCSWIWELSYADGRLEVQTTLKNKGTVPLSIGNWDIVNLSKRRNGNFKFGNNPADVRFFRWRPLDMRVETLLSDEGKHASDNLCLLYDRELKQTFLSAFLTMDRMHGRHTIAFSPSDGIEEYKATCSFGKFSLPPKQQFVSEKLQILFHTDPYDALEKWADYIYDIKKPVFPELAHVGLSSGAWRQLYSGDGHLIDHSKTGLDNARAFRSRLKGFDADIFRLSTYTTLKNGIPGNWMEANEDFFYGSNGYKNFLKELKLLGFKPGVWVSPFWFFSEADHVLKENEENLLRDCTGAPIHYTMNWTGNVADTSYMSRLNQYFLDGTHPKTVDYVKKVFSYNRDIGVRFYMLDFLQVPTNSCVSDPSQTPLQAARNILKVIRETVGADTHLQTAVSSTPAYSRLIDAARVGRDFGEGRPLDGAPLSDWGNATYILHDRNYANLHYLLQNSAASFFTHRKLYINDLNILTVDKPVPLEHARFATTIFGLCGSPLMLGDDIYTINQDRLNMIKLCLPRTAGWPVPIDLFENVYPNNYARYLKLPVKKSWGEYQLLAVFNNEDSAYKATPDFEKLGLDRNKAYRIYEFWNEEYLGTFRGHFEYLVPPGSCRLFRIAEAADHPWLLSTDMHIQQGAVEVEELNWDEKRMRPSGKVTRPIGETGNLFFLMPRKMRVVNTEGLWLMKELDDMNVIIRKEIKFTREHETFELFFEPWERQYIPEHLMKKATEEQWMERINKGKRNENTRVLK